MYIPEFWAGVVAGAFGCLAVIIVIGLAASKYQKHKKRWQQINAKEYLNQARGIEAILKVKQSELDELIKQLDSSPAQGVKVRTSTVSDKMKLVDVIVDYRAELLRETAALINLKKEIHGKINQLSKPIYIGILTEYYINARPWREISEILNISERHIYRIHGNALNEFREKFNMI